MEDNTAGSSRASAPSADVMQESTLTNKEGTAQEEAYITPRPSSSTPIHLKVDTKGKAKATDSDSSSSSSDSDSEDSPDGLSNASFESTPEWMRPIRGASADPSSSVSPPRSSGMQDYRQRTGSPESSLSPGGERRIGEKNKRALGDTGEWLPGQPPPDTWPDSPTAKRMLIPSTSPRAPRGTFPVGSPPRREDFASASFSDFVPDDEPRFEWRGPTQPTSPLTSARIRRPSSANFTPSVLSSAELESDDGSTDFDGEAATSSNVPDPEMDALVAEISKMLNIDNNGEALPQPIPVHTSDAYTGAGLESGFDGWHLSSSPGAATELSLMQVPMIDYEYDGPLDGESMEDYLSRTLHPDYIPPAYASHAAFQNFHFDPVGETTDPYSHLPHYAPPLEDEENPFSVEDDDYLVPRGPVVRVEARVPSTTTSDFSMPFQMSSARSAAQAADLIAEMQASGMLAQDPDAIAIDGELTPDDLLLLDNFGNLDLTSDEQMAWGASGIDLGTGIDLSGVDLSDAIDLGGDFDLGGPLTEADHPFITENANDLFDFPTTDNAPFTPTTWPPAESFDDQPGAEGALDAFDASFFGTNPQTFDWGNPDEAYHDPVQRTEESVRRES